MGGRANSKQTGHSNNESSSFRGLLLLLLLLPMLPPLTPATTPVLVLTIAVFEDDDVPAATHLKEMRN